MTTATLNRRLIKVEEHRPDLDTGREVDRMLEAMGTSRAAILAEHGTLWAYRDWLTARLARESEQTRGTKM